MWTQSLKKKYGGSHKEHFLNPIMQNRLHIRWLKKFLEDGGITDVPVYSIVAFSKRCTLMKVNVKSPDIKVINRNKVRAAVSWFEENALQGNTLSEKDIHRIYEMLYPFTQVSEETKETHIQNIKRQLAPDTIATPYVKAKVQEDAEAGIEESYSGDSLPEEREESAGICPWCGGRMVVRTAKRGTNAGKQFYGCSNYPKCRYVKRF